MYWGEVGDKYVKLLMKNNLYYDKDEKQVNATKYYERCEEVVDDMSNLSVLNDPQLLHNIHFRYQKDILFTYVGPTLLVVNPFKRIEGIFEQQKFFRDKIVTQKINFKDSHHHTFAIAAQALKMLSVKNQAIAISGESGAGKTENAKYCMNLLTLEGQMSEKILACNPFLEAFGNAKTARNAIQAGLESIADCMYKKTTSLEHKQQITYQKKVESYHKDRMTITFIYSTLLRKNLNIERIKTLRSLRIDKRFLNCWDRS